MAGPLNLHIIQIFSLLIPMKMEKQRLFFLLCPHYSNEEAKTAVSHFDFLAATLRIFGKTQSSIAFLAGENENLNKKIAKLLKVPPIGCASHMLNLAVKEFLRPYELLLKKIRKQW